MVIKRSLNDPGRCQQSIDLQTSARQNKSDTAPPWITDASLQQHVVQPSAQRDNSCLCVSFGIVETEHPVPGLRTYFWSHASWLCGPDFIAQLTSEKILWFNQVEKAIFFPIWTCVFFLFLWSGPISSHFRYLLFEMHFLKPHWFSFTGQGFVVLQDDTVAPRCWSLYSLGVNPILFNLSWPKGWSLHVYVWLHLTCLWINQLLQLTIFWKGITSLLRWRRFVNLTDSAVVWKHNKTNEVEWNQ